MHAAKTSDIHPLPGVLLIAVEDGIRESLAERYFDIYFTPVDVAEAIDERLEEPHELIYKGRDGRDSTGEALL